MQNLHLPSYQFKIKQTARGYEIWDQWRQKYILLTPEEWVRQHFCSYMVEQLGVPASRMALEVRLKLYKLNKRADAILYDNEGAPLVLVECKAYDQKLSQDTFDQAARYNITLKAPILVITNGMEHYACKINFNDKSMEFLKELPPYSEMLKMGNFN